MKKNICIITMPRQKASIPPLKNLIQILNEFSTNLYLITDTEGSKVSERKDNLIVHSIKYYKKNKSLLRLINYFYVQLQYIIKIIFILSEIDVFVFYMNEGASISPIFLKISRKRTIYLVASSLKNCRKSLKDEKIIHKIFEKFENLNYKLSNKLILYSPLLIEEWSLEKYQKKIRIAHKHFLDFSNFNIQKPFSNRSNLIGYIGRLSAEKGIQNFVEALPIIIDRYQDLDIIIGGDGPLKDDVKNSLEKQNISDHVTIYSWIAHDNLPSYFNKLRLIVLPSYTEGLPNIMLEAMACGTPVLATAVGAIPDVIKDGETGFIMENNSPGCIANNIIRALNHPHLEKISENARKLVEHEFTFEKAVNRFRKIIDEF
jgi:glycosyltransferase involved in cell wall biosynthesis